MTAATRIKPLAECDVVVTRVFDAPRSLVFKAWTEPRHLAQWWGPRDFTNPVCELDVRVGGAILIHTRGPGGIIYPMTGTFREIVAPERLVIEAVARDIGGRALIEGLITATFEEQGGKTLLTVREQAVGLAPAAVAMIGGMENTWAQSLERLDTSVSRG
jgi:uncharacterized protein YndB with AHSA1/START domain